ncbi:MAG TPA: hypothetical protein VF691_04175 [Cytophagaceae bacterium]|jgi:hypothetical protein
MKKEGQQLKTSVEDLISYVAKGNPNGVRKLAYKYGYQNFQTYQGSLNFLDAFLKKEGEKGFDDMIMQHPDRDLILEVYHSKYPQTLAFDSFEDGNIDPDKSLLNLIGVLIAKKKEPVIALLGRYNLQVNDREDYKEISDKISFLLASQNKAFEKELSNEIALLTGDNYSEFIGAIAQGVGQVANVFSASTKRKNDKENNSSAITLAALNYKLGSKKPEEDKGKKQTNLLIVIGVGAGVLILGIILLIIVKLKS